MLAQFTKANNLQTMLCRSLSTHNVLQNLALTVFAIMLLCLHNLFSHQSLLTACVLCCTCAGIVATVNPIKNSQTFLSRSLLIHYFLQNLALKDFAVPLSCLEKMFSDRLFVSFAALLLPQRFCQVFWIRICFLQIRILDFFSNPNLDSGSGSWLWIQATKN